MSEQQDTTEDKATRGRPRVLQGIVRSAAMNKTVVVEVSTKIKHKVYRKYLKRRKRFMAHDEKNEYQVGDVVKIASDRPLSKRKHWRVRELVERPQ